MTDKRIEWCKAHIQGFAEMYERAQKVRREEEENRQRFAHRGATP